MLLEYLKKKIIHLDKKLFNENLKSLKYFLEERRYQTYRNKNFAYGIKSEYKKNNNSELNILCEKYGSDKGGVSENNNQFSWPIHSYVDIYDLLFRLRKNDVHLLIECGVGTINTNMKSNMGKNGKPGASLRMWRDYFPNAKIIGVDIDKDVIFSEDRIKTYHCDQTDFESIQLFLETAKILDNSVDIIIDDGLHNFKSGRIFFEGMIKCLSNNGLYIIEDISGDDMMLYKDYFANLDSKFDVHFLSLIRPYEKINANRLIIINKRYYNKTNF